MKFKNFIYIFASIIFLISNINLMAVNIKQTNNITFTGKTIVSNEFFIYEEGITTTRIHRWDASTTNININGNLGSVTDGVAYVSVPVGSSQNLASVLTNGNDAAGQAATNFNYLHQTNQAVLFELGGDENIGLESTGYPVTRQQYGTWAGVGALSSCFPKYFQSSAQENSAFGYMSAYSSTGTSWCTALGNWAMSYAWGWGNLAIGNYAYSEGTGQWNVVIGPSAGWIMSGSENVAIGDSAGAQSASALNVAIGYYPLSESVADLTIGIGYTAFAKEFSGVESVGDLGVYIGSWAGSGAVGSYNTSIGSYAFKDGSGDENTSIGYQAMDDYIGGSSVGVGAFALRSDSTNFDNTAVGYLSMFANYSDWGGNSAVGAYSLGFVRGNYNSALGHSAAAGVNGDYWGSSNVMIGANSGRIHPYSGITNGMSRIRK